MQFELKNVKGTKDYMPVEQFKRNEIIKNLQKTFEIYGYQPLETPTIYYMDILASKYAGGAEILKETYTLMDQGNRQLALRYDLTVPFSKVIGMNPNMRMPFKRYEIGKVFRDGPVKLGRMREFTQCDVDVAGVRSVMAEAELMVMACEVFEKLGLDIYISYNNRKLLSGLLMMMEIDSDKTSDVILTLDKFKKIGVKGIEAEFLEKNITSESIDKIIMLLQNEKANSLEYYRNITQNKNMVQNKRIDQMKNIVHNTDIVINKNIKQNTLMIEGIDELEELEIYINGLGIAEKVKFNPFLARGLEIYTGTVYEIFLKNSPITSSLGAGGRYDKIIGEFLESDKEYPAVGISFGLDVIYEALTFESKQIKSNLDLYIIPLGTKLESMKILMGIRKKGIRADIDMTGRKLKKSLEFANKENIPFIAIIGEDELKKECVKIKNMEKGTEEDVEISDIAKYLMELKYNDRA